MTIHSLRSKINLIFSINLILLMLLFTVVYQYQKYRSEEEIVKQERKNIHYLYLYYLKYNTIDLDYLASQNIRMVTGEKEKALSKIFSQNKKAVFQAINYQNSRYVFYSNGQFKLLLENRNKPDSNFELILLFLGTVPLLILIYIWIIRSLRPISELKEKIKTFSKGNLDIDCGSNRGDEIADLANEFNDAIKTIRELIRSRQLFLRATMHELKTPIAKGRIVSEMLNDEKQKERLDRIFIRLNMLIDEFARIERVSSRNIHLKIEPWPVSTLIHTGLKLLMLDGKKDMVTFDMDYNETIEADIELFPTALKNLIANAIRYSPDHHVSICVKDRQIIISNKGKELSHNITEYFTPFRHSESGSGLGLYIVKSIVDIHRMRLRYNYSNGVNRFTIYY